MARVCVRLYDYGTHSQTDSTAPEPSSDSGKYSDLVTCQQFAP